MSFASRETSRFFGEPVDLFLFRYGTTTNAFFAYTDAEEPIVFEGVTYEPVTIKRANITSSGNLDKSALNLEMPINLGVAELFRVYPPGQVVTMIIRQGHIDDPDNDFPVIWTGRVIQCKREGSRAVITGEPVATSMRRTGLRRNYQLSCPHVLYGPLCRASKAAAKVTRPVILMTGTRITLQDGWSGAINPVKYIGGMVEWATSAGREVRTILRVESLKTLVLSGPTTELALGVDVDVFLGCNRQMGVAPQPLGDCGPLHNNIQNFGGQAWIPSKNPIKTNPFN